MPQIYEGMFLIDNDQVRAGWESAKALVTDGITKHGGTVHTARRWDERRLAYTIQGKNRATFLLCHYKMPADAIPSFLRELELREGVLRHLTLAVEEVPEGEAALHEAEQAADFTVPEPPADEKIVPVEFREAPPRERRSEEKPEEKSEDKPEDETAEKADGEKAEEGAEAKAEAKPEAKPEGDAPAATEEAAPAETPAATPEKTEA